MLERGQSSPERGKAVFLFRRRCLPLVGEDVEQTEVEQTEGEDPAVEGEDPAVVEEDGGGGRGPLVGTVSGINVDFYGVFGSPPGSGYMTILVERRSMEPDVGEFFDTVFGEKPAKMMKVSAMLRLFNIWCIFTIYFVNI